MADLVDVDAVKLHLRKGSDTSEDTLIASYLAAAIGWVENYTGHLLEEREVTDTFADWGEALTLRHQPIRVDDPTPTLTVTYDAAEGDETEYTSLVIRDQRYPWTIHPPTGEAFPTLADSGAIAVTYTAGYPDGEVPDPLNAAVLLLVGHWHSHRSAVAESPLQEAPLSVVSLCRPYRGAVMA